MADRIGIALTGGSPDAPQRALVDAVATALAEGGADVDGFVENERLRESRAFPVRHYMRLEDLHRERPYSAVVSPVGRDGSLYGPSQWVLREMASVVWLLEPGVHHLYLGQALGRAGWMHYGARLEEALGDDADTAFGVVRAGWATGSFYRKYDMIERVSRGQHGALALTEPVRARAERRGVPCLGVTGIPRLELWEGERREDAGGGLRELTVASLNPGFTGNGMDLLYELKRARPELIVHVLVAGPIYDVSAGPAAHRRGLHDAIDWIWFHEQDRFRRAALRSDALLFLSPDVTLHDRLILQQAAAKGVPLVVPDVADLADLPEEAALRLPLGRRLPDVGHAEIMRRLDDPAGREVARRGGRGHADAQPTAREVAARILELVKGAPEPVLRDPAGPVWDGWTERIRARIVEFDAEVEPPARRRGEMGVELARGQVFGSD